MRILTFFLMAVVAAPPLATAQAGPWEHEDSGTTSGLRGIYAVGGGVVWASGANGTVLRSEDTGYLWQQCAVPPGAGKLDFRAIWASDDQNALVMSSGPGDQSRLYRTVDGCTSWKLMYTNPDAGRSAEFPGFWDGLLFLDRENALIYGDPVPTAARTQIVPFQESHDGGTAWSPGKPLQALPGESFFAASNSAMATYHGEIWAGTSKSRILHSTNHQDWESASAPLASGNDSSGVFSLAFRDRMHGIAVGGDYRKPEQTTGTAAFTADGGKHWSPAGKPPHGYRSAVAWDLKHQAWITVGSNGSDISYDDGATWQWLDGGNWNALSLPWVVGPNGQIGKLGTLPANPAAAASVSR